MPVGAAAEQDCGDREAGEPRYRHWVEYEKLQRLEEKWNGAIPNHNRRDQEA